MDVESKTTNQDIAIKQAEDAPQNASSNAETNGSVKDSPKNASKSRRGQPRSRSRTPQKKTEDAKMLHVTLRKLDTELNGKEVQEETEKLPEKEKENERKAEVSESNGDKSLTEEKSVVEEELSKDKKNPKEKEDKPKKDEATISNSQEKKEKETPKKAEPSKKESPRKEKKDKVKKGAVSQENELETESVEMDPLVVTDEPDPELQFDDNSDESGKTSPVIVRCVTRRSLTRNIPTPKTPKSVDQDSEKNSATHTPTTEVENDTELLKADNLNDSCEYMDSLNLSTKAEVGSDATRMDYIEHHNSNFEDSSYISASREKSLSETLRGLSARRPIRPLDDYRRRVLRGNQEKSDLNIPYTSYDSVEQVMTGIKRKSRSITPEDRKKFKSESPGLNSLFSSPLANIRNKFKSDLPSSTPKLLSYRDARNRMHYNQEDHFENGDDEKKSWCSIM